MAIAPRPGSRPPTRSEAAADRFISGAGTLPPAVSRAGHIPSPPDDSGRRQPAMIRFDRALLARIDRAAKHRGVSRSAWIQYTLSKALDEEDPST